MSTRVTPPGSLTDEQVHSVLIAAAAAPSPHNSQPWRFRCTPGAIELYADTTRTMPDADPDHRELLLACGAALLNLRLAIRALGVHPAVQLFPDSNQPDLLAVVRLQGRSPAGPVDRRLAEAIARRRANRRPLAATTVPLSLLNGLRQAAKIEQAWMATLDAAQLPILRILVAQAHDAQQHNPRWYPTTDSRVPGTPVSRVPRSKRLISRRICTPVGRWVALYPCHPIQPRGESSVVRAGAA